MHLFWITALVSFLANMLAKAWADAFLHERVALWGEWVGLRYSLNEGIAFGVRLPPILQEFLIGLALLLVLWLAYRSPRTKPLHVGYGLIVGGALGNVVDRFADGVVTDFFQIGSFPIFNVADSCITVGAAFLLAESFGLFRRTHN